MPSKQKKHPKPVRVRGKIDLHQPIEKKLTKSQSYILAQTNNDPQNLLANQAAKLVQTRTALMDVIKKRENLKVQLDAAQTDVIAADADHDQAMRDYADGAAKVAGSDASLLVDLGVEAVSPPDRQVADDVAAPKLTVTPGEQDGEAIFKASRVAGAGSYEYQYKLEPSQPSDPWLPGGATKRVSFTVSGLAHEQRVRARARAIGNTPGPWSDDVIGEAR